MKGATLAAMGDGETLEVSTETFMMINHHHGEHPGEPLTLTWAQVCELAGCAGDEPVETPR